PVRPPGSHQAGPLHLDGDRARCLRGPGVHHPQTVREPDGAAPGLRGRHRRCMGGERHGAGHPRLRALAAGRGGRLCPQLHGVLRLGGHLGHGRARLYAPSEGGRSHRARGAAHVQGGIAVTASRVRVAAVLVLSIAACRAESHPGPTGGVEPPLTSPAAIPEAPVSGTIGGAPFVARSARYVADRRVGYQRTDIQLSAGAAESACGPVVPANAPSVWIRLEGSAAIEAQELRPGPGAGGPGAPPWAGGGRPGVGALSGLGGGRLGRRRQRQRHPVGPRAGPGRARSRGTGGLLSGRREELRLRIVRRAELPSSNRPGRSRRDGARGDHSQVPPADARCGVASGYAGRGRRAALTSPATEERAPASLRSARSARYADALAYGSAWTTATSNSLPVP